MQFTGDLYRYALADALVATELASSPAPDLSSAARLQHRADPDVPQPIGPDGKRVSAKKHQAALDAYEQARAYNYLSRYGECIVRTDTGGSRSLLMTTQDSEAEVNAFKHLQLALGTCVPEGQTLRFGRTALRGTIAINYYRLVRSVQPRSSR
jgi:hypothetical protein